VQVVRENQTPAHKTMLGGPSLHFRGAQIVPSGNSTHLLGMPSALRGKVGEHHVPDANRHLDGSLDARRSQMKNVTFIQN
jgi:hypothetical protein